MQENKVRVAVYMQVSHTASCTHMPHHIPPFYPLSLGPWPLALGTESQGPVVEVYPYRMGHPFNNNVHYK